MSFGISLQPSLDTLGPYFLDSKFLGPDNSNILTNITHLVTVPTALKKGTKVYFVAALTSLFGAGYSPTLTHYQVPVKVGDFTSNGDLVSSLQH